MKKALCVLLALIISIASTSFVFASTNESSERNVLNTGVSFNNPESDPYNDYVNARKEAELKASILAAKETGAKDIETVSVTCPTRPQITHYWAGLAAAEQVIRANGNSNNLTATYGSVADGAGGTVSGTYHQFTINSWLGASVQAEPVCIRSLRQSTTSPQAVSHGDIDTLMGLARHVRTICFRFSDQRYETIRSVVLY